MRVARCRCRWGPAFFGLKPEDREGILEQAFQLTYYMGLTYTETYNLPVAYREWFIRRLSKQLQGKGQEEGTRAAESNTAEVRALQGREREQVPARMRRFT